MPESRRRGRADLVVGAVLVPGAAAPKLVSEDMVRRMRRGSVLVDSLFESSSDEIGEVRGRIPGGGVVQKSRSIGLAISSEHASVRTSRMIGVAIKR